MADVTRKLSERVATEILEMITLQKRFSPGDKIPTENELCAELGVSRTTLREAAAHYRQHEPKGEFVLVVEGAKPKETREEYTLEEAAELARDFLQDGVSASEAAREAAKVSGLKKGDIYRLLG